MRGRIAWKRRIGQLYALMRARDAQRKLILLYHSVGDSIEATAQDAFRDQLGVIAAMGQLLPLRELLGSAPNQSIAVAVTFDDGYATLRDHAATILTEFGGAATIPTSSSSPGAMWMRSLRRAGISARTAFTTSIWCAPTPQPQSTRLLPPSKQSSGVSACRATCSRIRGAVTVRGFARKSAPPAIAMALPAITPP
jgi:hypothetical protein